MVKNTAGKQSGKISTFLKKAFSRIWKRKWWVLAGLVLVVSAYVIIAPSGKKEAVFATVDVTRGNLKQVVTATGEIRPVNTILVGSQVSGNIDTIYVDFNDEVKKGDLLLTIEPSVLQASVDEAKASLDSAESQRNFAKNEYDRSKMLYNEGFIARAEMEQALTTFETSEQSVNRAKSQYERAKTNLGYATITSPVDGTVISRKVDKGQTVAASFQAPDLFEIAEDLSKMQIETSVSEADIGMVKEKQKVTFTVDAYPTQTFEGYVRQIRLSPTTTSNVVVYTAVIDVDNHDLRLMPGMTAFVTITVSERTDTLKARNAAFLVRSFADIVPEAADKSPREYLAVLRGNEEVPQLVAYKRGVVTATETEIISDEVKEGDKIITGRLGARSTANANVSFGAGGGNRGGARR